MRLSILHERRDVIRLAREDPTVNAFVRLWQCGEGDWEHVMCGLVVRLADDNRRMLERLVAQERLCSCKPLFAASPDSPPEEK